MISFIEGLKIKFFIPGLSLLKGSLFRGFNVLFAFTVHVLNLKSKFLKISLNEFPSFYVKPFKLGCKLLPWPHESSMFALPHCRRTERCVSHPLDLILFLTG
jgi:hypothetical protein